MILLQMLTSLFSKLKNAVPPTSDVVRVSACQHEA
jgi:hypothetical protein